MFFTSIFQIADHHEWDRISVIAFLVGGYIMTQIFLFFYKKLFGRRLVYGMQYRSRPERFKGALSKAFVPALLAMHIGLWVSTNQAVQEIIFVLNILIYMDPVFRQVLTLLVSFPIVSAISMFLFAGPYFLLDSCIVHTNKDMDDVKDGLYPTEVQSVGGWYMNVIGGFAGLSILYDFAVIIVPYILKLMGMNPVILVTNITMPLMPLLIAFLMVPAIIVQDVTVKARQKYIYKVAEKMGIKGVLMNPLGEDRPTDAARESKPANSQGEDNPLDSQDDDTPSV